MALMHDLPMEKTLAQLRSKLEGQGYIAEDTLVMTLLLMEQLQRPLLIEGEAGVGKTEIAKSLAAVHSCPLIRLQCYEGLDTNAAVYEWNYSHQLLSIKLQESRDDTASIDESGIFSEKYLLERPLLKAIRQDTRPVLLIDEIDRADEAFEAYLLELLSDFQISIPELGTIKAHTIPLVILTSNAMRELSDALRRRCVYHYLDYPDTEKELEIIRRKIPGITSSLSQQIVNFVQKLRLTELRKKPGIAETLDWSAALLGLNQKDQDLTSDVVYRTRSCLLKTQDDILSLTESNIRNLLKQSQ